MPRTSKISQLPRPIREDLNHRLERAEPARSILKWLNALPEVQSILEASFKGEPVNEQNITNWRRSGFASWQLRQDFLERLHYLTDESADLTQCADKMADHAARLLSIHIALLLSPSSGPQSQRSDSPPPSSSSSYSSSSSSSNPSSQAHPSSPPAESSTPEISNHQSSLFLDLKSLCQLTRAVVSLRRSNFQVARLQHLLDQPKSKPRPLKPQSSAPSSESAPDADAAFALEMALIRRRARQEKTARSAFSNSLPEHLAEDHTSSLPNSPPPPLSPSPKLLSPPNLNQEIPAYSPSVPSVPSAPSSSPAPEPPAFDPHIPPPVAPDKGDLTPAYVRWLLKTQPLEVCRQTYAGRERHLPPDLRTALQATPSP